MKVVKQNYVTLSHNNYVTMWNLSVCLCDTFVIVANEVSNINIAKVVKQTEVCKGDFVNVYMEGNKRNDTVYTFQWKSL